MKNGDMPSMPFEEVRSRVQGLPDKWVNHKGLTKREMIAMHIASGLASNPEVRTDKVASAAVKFTDELLAELERTEQ